MKKCLLLLALSASLTSVLADVVYITGRPTPTGTGANPNGTYTELIAGSDTSAKSTAVGVPARDGERFFSSATFTNSQNTGAPFLRLTPTLGVAGGIYQVHYTHSSTAGNTTLDAIARFSNAALCTLSFTNTDKFQRPYGTPAPQPWYLLGYLTNDPGQTTPTLEVYLVSATNINSSTARFPVDCFRFSLYVPCLDVPAVSVTGPLSSNVNTVVVSGVSNVATKITVYQDSGSGMVQIGSKTTGIVGGNNSVTVSGLVKGAQVAATQTLGTQEGCVPVAGTLVGGGANPSVRMALSIRETPSTGPVGGPGSTASANIHFLGATTVSGGAPTDSAIVYPSNGWQTVTFSAGREYVGNSANAAGTANNAGGYAANDSVSIKVYAYRTVPANSVTIYSLVAAQSAVVTSNDVFAVNWTWSAVSGADGYRLLREVNAAGYNEYTDVVGVNVLSDNNTVWAGGNTVTPTNTQIGASIQWNPSVSNPNNIPTTWGILEGLALTIDDTTDTGPFDIYVDNIKNGTTTFQTFEEAPATTTDYGFRAPSFSGTTSGNLLPTPNAGVVVNHVADTGTKSFRIQFQWNDLTTTKWLRLTTSGVNNPQVNLDEPISLRLLMQPVNANLPTPPAAPSLTATALDGKTVLNWPGGHRLQSSVNVTDTYTNLPQTLSPNVWTNINLGGYLSPWTNNLPEATRFFRLLD